MSKSERKQISEEFEKDAIETIRFKLRQRLEEKGRGTLASRHEVIGVILEEFDEAQKALQNTELNNFMGEILDIAVGCAFAIACFRQGTLEW